MSAKQDQPISAKTWFVECDSKEGKHKVALHEYGPADSATVVFCVHGLTRNAGDFKFFAEYLVKNKGYRVVCMDVVGRGQSDWLKNKTLYDYFQYCGDAAMAIAHVRHTMPAGGKLVYFGTSMGGLIGTFLSQMPTGAPYDALILNDVGPSIPKAALESIKAYISAEPRFPTQDAALGFLKSVYGKNYGKHGIAEPGSGLPDLLESLVPYNIYQDTAVTTPTPSAVAAAAAAGAGAPSPSDDLTGRFTGKGDFRLMYDHAGIAAGFAVELKDLDAWPVWEGIKVPALVLRGARSDLLTAEVALGMATRGPKAEVQVYDDAAHVPPLYRNDDNARVAAWIAKHDAAAAAAAASPAAAAAASSSPGPAAPASS